MKTNTIQFPSEGTALINDLVAKYGEAKAEKIIECATAVKATLDKFESGIGDLTLKWLFEVAGKAVERDKLVRNGNRIGKYEPAEE